MAPHLLVVAFLLPCATALATSSARVLPQPRLPCANGAPQIAMQFGFGNTPDLSDPEVFPKDADGKSLITYASLDKTGAEMIEAALADRNRERILTGLPKYESVQDMVDSYVEFEGREQGLSRAQCEGARGICGPSIMRAPRSMCQYLTAHQRAPSRSPAVQTRCCAFCNAERC